ncbi:hypothetical protein [Pseudomonas gessardii]|uniref:hypothetical protein n=1 Tax=Pseudomonas gessardii TaxID=78544 RepID=UPI0018D8DEA4|nr:hypothetical protein [Pseudomonas gessardii]MBH3424862.1 hypothetical protein [Pseudomonas gessardii]
MSNFELDELFDQANAVPEEGVSVNPFAHLKSHSAAMDDVLNHRLARVFSGALALDRKKALASRIDGRIIGTGEEDFTKGNTFYTLNYKGKRFQLIDVPGIEGDEGKYAHCVREAVAKAHLVFYVNGTNKKPEKATAQKIRSYLRLGTQVCPLMNVRGNADQYEFDGVPAHLESEGDSTKALQQTVNVLESVLGAKTLHPGHCVQGLLAFSSLAVAPGTEHTTIHPSRERNLVIHQRNYRKYFASSKAMYEFSQIKSVAQVLHGKLGTFKEDMIESNKSKVHELLVENLGILQELHTSHELFVARTEPEFAKCRAAINDGQARFERLLLDGRKNLWNGLFIDLSAAANNIVEAHFGNNDLISTKIQRAFKERQEQLKDDLQTQFEKCLAQLQGDLVQAMQRLLEDVSRVEFEQAVAYAGADLTASYKTPDLGLGLDLKDYGWMLFNVGSYALAGAGIGTAFPVVGNLIGAAIGAAVGFLINLMNFFLSEEKRMRKAQAQVQEKIAEARTKAIDSLRDELKGLLAPVRSQIEEKLLGQVNDIHASLIRPLHIIKQQMALMQRTKDQLEKMPHGTIHAI